MSQAPDAYSIAEASKLGVEALVREAGKGREQVILRDDKPVAVITSFEQFARWQQLLDDLVDITFVAGRTMTPNDIRLSLDDVLARFGYTREELAKKPDAPLSEPRARTAAKEKGAFRAIDLATHPLIGRWRIVEMDMWDRAFIDLVEPGYIEFNPGGSGEFAFGAVNGSLDCGYAPSSIHFTWVGSDEMDEAFGDGWAELQDDGTVIGEIAFFQGDESGFKARRW